MTNTNSTARTMLVTGANGFVGHALCEVALFHGFQVKGATRRKADLPDGVEPVVVGDIGGHTDWAAALHGVDVVIHLAARVHVMRDRSKNPLADYLAVNLHGTANLARQAAKAGVKRLLYLSSIKVNGEQTAPGQRFSITDAPNPQDSYAISKWQAEQALHAIADDTGLEVVVIRPPLIYGPRVRGNMLKLLRAIDRGMPLPLGRVNNVRSMLYLDNLLDILLLCAIHVDAANKTYLVRDGDDLSISQLIRYLAEGQKKSPHLFSFPLKLLRALAWLTGWENNLERLTGSLHIDDDPIRRELGWRPRFSARQGLIATSAWYLRNSPISGT